MEIEPIRYRLYVSNASGTVWDTRFKDPNPFIEIFLDGKSIYTTTTKRRTLAPVWNECVEVESNNPTSLLSLKLCHRGTSGNILPIGSKKLTVQDLGYLANRDVSLDLDDNNTKIGVLVKKKRPGVKKAASPPELCPCPNSESPRRSPDPEQTLQVVDFNERNVSMDQAARIIRQSLARAAMH